MNSVKISSHRARITEVLNRSAYVRDSDSKIIIVLESVGYIDASAIPFEISDDTLMYSGFVLTGIHDDMLMWDHEDHPTIIWRKGDFDQLKQMAEFLYKMSQGQGSTGPSQMLQLKIEQTESAPSKASPIEDSPTQMMVNTVSARDVNDMVIPTLKEQDYLSSHIEQIQDLAEDMHIIQDGHVVPKLKVAFAMKVLDSLKEVPVIQSTMNQLMSSTQYDFFAIKDVLLKTFCNRTRLKNIVRERLSKLTYKGHALIETFLTDASMILSLVTRLYQTDWILEYTSSLREIMTKLAPQLRARIHNKLSDLSDEGRWELALPFDDTCARADFFKDHIHYQTIADLIRKQCSKFLELDEIKGVDSYTPKSSNRDKVNYIHTESPSEFARKFKAAFVVFNNPNLQPDAASNLLKQNGFEVRNQLSHKTQRPYFIVGSHDDPYRAKQTLTQLSAQGIKHREFEFRESKNSQRDSQ
jgi:hypothetical protein